MEKDKIGIIGGKDIGNPISLLNSLEKEKIMVINKEEEKEYLSSIEIGGEKFIQKKGVSRESLMKKNGMKKLFPLMDMYGISSPRIYNNSELIYFAEEYKLIKDKKSTLPRTKRNNVEKVFEKHFEKLVV